MKLCQKDYYNGTLFHRSIKHFMVNTKYLLYKLAFGILNYTEIRVSNYLLSNKNIRFKEEIRQVQEKVDSRTGNPRSKMNLSPTYPTLEEEF